MIELDPIEEEKRKRIHEMMDRLAVSQSGLAKLIHMSQGYISHIVSGKKPITKKFVRSMSEHLGVNTEWLLTGNGEMFTQVPDMNRLKQERSGNRGEPPSESNYSSSRILTVPALHIHQIPERVNDIQDAILHAEKWPMPTPDNRLQIEALFVYHGSALFPRIKPGGVLITTSIEDPSHLPSGKENIFVIYARDVLRVGFIKNESLSMGTLTLYFENDALNQPEVYNVEEIERIWSVVLVQQNP